jgi:hypothetical protein
MPRKVGPPPVIFKVELLSTGREYRPNDVGVDDFGDQRIERVQDNSPARELPDAQELQDAANRAKRADKRKLAELLFPTKPAEPKLVPKAIPGMRPVGELAGHAIYVPKAPWRRI